MNNSQKFVLGLLLGSYSFSVSAVQDKVSVNNRIVELQRQLLELKQEIDHLKKKNSEQSLSRHEQLPTNSDVNDAKSTSTQTTPSRGQAESISAIPEVTTKTAKVSLEGRVHFDYNWFDGAYNAGAKGEAGSDWFARRIRTGLDSELGDWEHSLVLEFADNTAEIIIARVRYNGLPNGVKLQFGKLREDISLNALTSSNDTGLMERSSLADSFSPYFRWGASAYQLLKDSGVRWALGVHKNDAFGASGKDQDGEVNLAYNARLSWGTTDEQSALHLGAWHSHRDMGGDELASKLARGEIRRAATRIVDYAVGGDLVRLDKLSQSGVEFGWMHQSLTIEAEFARRTLDALDPQHKLDGAHQQGYHISLSFFPQGYQRVYNRGAAVFAPPKQISHAWEVLGRISRLDASTLGQGTDVTSYTFGLSYYFNPNVKVMGNLVYSDIAGYGQSSLSSNDDSGTGFAARLHYVF